MSEQQRLFTLYINAKTDENGHIAGQRMLIAKEYKRKFNGANLRLDLIAATGWQDTTPRIARQKNNEGTSSISPRVKQVDSEVEYLREIVDKYETKFGVLEERIKKQEDVFLNAIFEQKQDFNRQLDILRKQLKAMYEKSK